MLWIVSFSFVVLLTGDSDAKCVQPPLKAIDWTFLSGMWYNTYSHKGDALQIDGLCSSMVVAGEKGYDGVAVVRNVVPEANRTSSEALLTGVAQFFIKMDPSVYKLDPSSELEWLDIHLLGKLMPKEHIPKFVNAITQHYMLPFQVIAGRGYIIIMQCDCSGERKFLWVYTHSPNPSTQKIAMIKRHIQARRFKGELQKNEACLKSLTKIYERANGHK